MSDTGVTPYAGDPYDIPARLHWLRNQVECVLPGRELVWAEFDALIELTSIFRAAPAVPQGPGRRGAVGPAMNSGPRRGKDCPGDCGRTDVPPHLITCRPCWFRLPKPMRDAVWNTHSSGDRGGHLQSLDYITKWLRAHPPAVNSRLPQAPRDSAAPVAQDGRPGTRTPRPSGT